MYRYADPIRDAGAYEADSYDRVERFERWEEENCKCSCGKDAEYKIDGYMYCQDCVDKEFLLDGDKVEYSVDGEVISELNFFSRYLYGTDERWEDFPESA